MKRNKPGFTLAELVIVVALTALLASVMWVFLGPLLKDTKVMTVNRQYSDLGDRVLDQLSSQLRYSDEITLGSDDALTQIAAQGYSIVETAGGQTSVIFDEDFFGQAVPALEFAKAADFQLSITVRLSDSAGNERYSQTTYVSLPNLRLNNKALNDGTSAVISYR